jgi:hypothetical protein
MFCYANNKVFTVVILIGVSPVFSSQLKGPALELFLNLG